MSARSRGDRYGTSDLSDEEYQKIVVQGDAKLLTEKAEAIGNRLASQLGLTTNQIRNPFGTVRRIEMAWGPRATDREQQQAARQLILLKPKLAYQAAREKGAGVRALVMVLTPAIDLVGEDRERFQNFVDFFEAILAYHTEASARKRRD